jgi:streptogramin lyase
MQGMASFAGTRRNSRWVLPLLALLALAAALWYVSTLIADPVGSTDGSAKTEGYSHEFSIYGSGSDRLHRPTEVATDADGNLYVADSFKNRITVFDSKGGFLRTFGSPANVDGALRYPSSVVVDDRGRAYVTSSEPGRIVIYKSDGTVLKSLDVPDPLTMAIMGNRLYVATSKGILIGDLDGNQIGQLLSHGKAPGQIDRPTGIAVGDDGTIYLADSLNYRFQAVDAKGNSLWVVGTQPDGATAVTDKDREFGLPSGLVLARVSWLASPRATDGKMISPLLVR